METKHTPGPWAWINSQTDEPFDFTAQWDGGGRPSLRTVEHFGKNETVKCDTGTLTTFALPKWVVDAEPMPNDSEVNAANARLIAAAPDLLAELRTVVFHLRRGDFKDNDSLCEQAVTSIEAAIEKATATAAT